MWYLFFYMPIAYPYIGNQIIWSSTRYMAHVFNSSFTIWMNEYSLDFVCGDLHYMAAIFVDNGMLCSLPRFDKFASTSYITTSCLSGVCFWIEYDNVVLHRLTIFRWTIIYLLTSEDIQPNAPMYYFRHEQLLRSPCCFFCDMRISTYIQSESNEVYVTVEFKLQKIYAL